MTETANHPTSYATADHGRAPAFIVYVLYIVGVFSAQLVSPIGVIIAYAMRGDAAPWVRTHFDMQIKMFWTVFWWVVGLGGLGVVLSPILIGIPLIIAAVVAAFILTIWFGVKSVIGLLRLNASRPT